MSAEEPLTLIAFLKSVRLQFLVLIIHSVDVDPCCSVYMYKLSTLDSWYTTASLFSFIPLPTFLDPGVRDPF